MTRANEKYTTKRWINVHIVFIIQKSLERVWHEEKYLKMLDFPKKRDKNLPCIEKYANKSVFICIDRLESSMLNVM